MLEHFEYAIAQQETLASVSVHAGFPNPAADSDRLSTSISLDKLLITRPTSTFLFQVRGDQWMLQGIFDGDIAVIDRLAQAQPFDYVVAWIDGQFTLIQKRRVPRQLIVWGTLTSVIHRYGQPKPR
jgi:DNA polymerase V